MLTVSYPKLNIDLDRIAHNARQILQRCGNRGIDVSVVVKGVNADPMILRTLQKAGVREFATSRLYQVERSREDGITADWLLLRSSQMCECADTVRLCRCSLQTERSVLHELEKECVKQNTTHEVLFMADMGDLREGYYEEEEFLSDVRFLTAECPHLLLKGIGTNFGDFTAVPATPERLERLIDLAHKAEAILGRPLERLSGGSTFVYPLVHNGTIPGGINHLRIGETILLAHDLAHFYELEGLDYLKAPTMTLQAEIIEVKIKPTASEGHQVVDAFGNIPQLLDRGLRKRALVALGRLDIGQADKIMPLDPGVEVVGATSDHLIVDVQDAPRNYVPGDILTFRLHYEAMLFATASPSLKKEYNSL